MNGITRFKWWWGWNCEPVEAWLEDMEAQGWRLERIGGGGTVFHFLPGQAARVRCCVDYQPKARASWQQLLQDDGWQVISATLGWYICRKSYAGERPELFNDWDSLIARNRRLIAILLAVFIPCLAALLASLGNLGRSAGGSDPLRTILLVEFFILVLPYTYFFARLAAANRLLKRKKALRDK